MKEYVKKLFSVPAFAGIVFLLFIFISCRSQPEPVIDEPAVLTMPPPLEVQIFIPEPEVIIEEPLIAEIPVEIFSEILPDPQSPKLSAPTMNIININSSRVEILVTINIENPNIFELPSPVISYDYSLNKVSYIRGIVESDVPLAASSVTPLNFLLWVTYTDLYRNMRLPVSANELASQLSLSCSLECPVFGVESFNWLIAGTLPLRR
ncbi:MAG: hypothetical protein FWC21_00935 [Treponema sp.]|nr:hypothetical protein [Treponema sp.]